MRTSDEYAEMYAIDEQKPSNRQTPEHKNMSLIDMLIKEKWIIASIKSFIALFGYMSIIMHPYIYHVYYLIIGLGIIGYFLKYYKFKYVKELKENKDKLLLEIMFVINIIIPIGLSIYYSYFSDYEPQGRYIMAMLIPLMYFITTGLINLLEKIKKEKVKKIITSSILATFVLLFCNCMTVFIKFIILYM